jgi:hypothetical protein
MLALSYRGTTLEGTVFCAPIAAVFFLSEAAICYVMALEM